MLSLQLTQTLWLEYDQSQSCVRLQLSCEVVLRHMSLPLHDQIHSCQHQLLAFSL